ncbi:MAG: peptidoglycan-associated lipoprotein Pal [Proteobacteria bacterium]|nr:peptidoglycan-associated lipoprotein Pal [Pseudomonadota bacterium]
MLLNSKLAIATFAVIVGISSCADDKKKPVEPLAAADQAATPDTPPTPAPAAEIKAEPIYFGFDDYTLTSEAQAKLTAMSEGLKASKSAAIQIEGHCDERGTVEYNLALGERRAQSVKSFLSQLGVEAARLSTISFGEERPVDREHSEGAWSKNRRAEFIVTNNK